MATTRRVTSSRKKVQAVRSKAFVREAHRQSRLIAESAQEKDDQAFVDAISEWTDE